MFAGMNNENDLAVQKRNINLDQQIKNNSENVNVGQQSMQAELKIFLNELKKPNTIQPVKDANNNNFHAANDSAFGSYTPF